MINAGVDANNWLTKVFGILVIANVNALNCVMLDNI